MKQKQKGVSEQAGKTGSPEEVGDPIDELETSADAGSDALSDDEMAAFKKIMGEVEGQEDEKSNDTSAGGEGEDDIEPASTSAELEKETAVAAASETEDDFSSELEKVVIEADAAESGVPGDEDPDQSGNELDEDQQKAFESIMAQIEGGAEEDTENESDKEELVASTSGTDVDFSAELEKVAQEADTAESDASNDIEISDLNVDLEGGDTADAEPGLDSMASSDQQTETFNGTDREQENKPIEQSDDEQGDGDEDISTDIDDILKEITLEETESIAPEADTDKLVSELATDDATDDTDVDDDIVVEKKEDTDPPLDTRPETAPRDPSKEKSLEPEIAPSTKSQADKKSAVKQSTSPKQEIQHQSKLLPKTQPTHGRRKKRVLLVSVAAIIFLSLAGYVFLGKWQSRVQGVQIPIEKASRSNPVVDDDVTPQQKQSVTAVQESSDESRLRMSIEKLQRLRSNLIEKQKEIEDLRVYYKAGIADEIRQIVDTIREKGKSSITLKRAMATPRINLGLNAIQRRNLYIKKLETPIEMLIWNSEELLYFIRKAELLILMTNHTSDIDVDVFIHLADEKMDSHQQFLAQLNIDAVPASPLALEAIWQDINKQLSKAATLRKKENTAKQGDNASIWRNICDGNYLQKHRLTALSPDAARCLSKWKGKDLFLNALTELSPDAAKQLSAWDGDWLGLNGLKDLSPETAAHLARWEGKGLSLNGLTRLSPRLVAIFSDWHGEQIELVNVKHIAHWENPNTTLFLSEGLNRKRDARRE